MASPQQKDSLEKKHSLTESESANLETDRPPKFSIVSKDSQTLEITIQGFSRLNSNSIEKYIFQGEQKPSEATNSEPKAQETTSPRFNGRQEKRRITLAAEIKPDFDLDRISREKDRLPTFNGYIKPDERHVSMKESLIHQKEDLVSQLKRLASLGHLQLDSKSSLAGNIEGTFERIEEEINSYFSGNSVSNLDRSEYPSDSSVSCLFDKINSLRSQKSKKQQMIKDYELEIQKKSSTTKIEIESFKKRIQSQKESFQSTSQIKELKVLISQKEEEIEFKTQEIEKTKEQIRLLELEISKFGNSQSSEFSIKFAEIEGALQLKQGSNQEVLKQIQDLENQIKELETSKSEESEKDTTNQEQTSLLKTLEKQLEDLICQRDQLKSKYESIPSNASWRQTSDKTTLELDISLKNSHIESLSKRIMRYRSK